MHVQGVSIGVGLLGVHFGQNGQKLHENDKIGVFWVKIVEGVQAK